MEVRQILPRTKMVRGAIYGGFRKRGEQYHMVNLKQAVVLGVIVLSALVLSACKKTAPATNNGGTTPSTQESQTTSPADAVVVTYNGTTFSPNPVTVKVGQTVEFKNTSSTLVQINSAPHPTHEQFSELNLDSIAAGQSKTTTFSKAGTNRYHNHLNASQHGQIIVQ